MIKIYIRRQPGTLDTELYVVDEPGKAGRSGDVLRFLNFKPTGEAIITNQVINYGATMEEKPTMIIPEGMVRELIAGFADLARAEGVEVKSESFATGKLAATERHLADLQTIVFKKNK